MRARHQERHRTERIGWLRAAVLGANDGIVSTASLVVGVAASKAATHEVLIAGIAGLVAGSMSMAAGEYVSVSSQSDTERADLERERAELATDKVSEHAELAEIYVKRGLDRALANQVADQLMAHDALGAHARDELGISETMSARPVQAAFASAATFAVGAAMPLLTVLVSPPSRLIPLVSGTSLFFLALLGGLAARAGGASIAIGAVRVTFWGALAMALCAGVGALFGDDRVKAVALFRGINVGKAKRIGMADLAACFESLGYGDVKTLLNSGNVVFSAPAAALAKAGPRIEKAVETKHGLKSRVTVLTAAEVAAIVKENPLGKFTDDPSRFFVTVLADPADRARLQPLLNREWSPDALAVGKRVAYCWCPAGSIESPLSIEVAKLLKDSITTRNWATILKLHALLTDNS